MWSPVSTAAPGEYSADHTGPPMGNLCGLQSGRADLNCRPHGPEPCALAELSHAPPNAGIISDGGLNRKGMTLANLWLILGSAVIHVVAHVALKRTHNRAAFVWWMLLWGGLLFAPVLIFGWLPVPPVAWGVMLASAVFEALYFAAIAQAYRVGDLSIVYPLARGTAPVLLLIWSAGFLRERTTPAGVGGIVLIAAGLYAVNLPRLGAWREPLEALGQAGPRWALLAGLCISGYTVIDRVGIGLFKPSPASWPR